MTALPQFAHKSPKLSGSHQTEPVPCGPCRLVGPVVEEIATQYAGRLTVGKLNVDEHPAVAQRSGITSIPALVFFHEGQVRDTVVGAVPTHVLTARVDEVLRQTAARGPAQRTASR